MKALTQKDLINTQKDFIITQKDLIKGQEQTLELAHNFSRINLSHSTTLQVD